MKRRGPPPTPTYLRLLRGNPGHRPINPDEPKPEIATQVPPPPPLLTGYAEEEWRRIVVELYRLRLVTSVDIHPLAAYCQSYKIWREASEAIAEMAGRSLMKGLMIKNKQGEAVRNPLISVAAKAARDMVSYAVEFGLTPAARARIGNASYGQKTQVGKFDGLINYDNESA